MADDKSNSNNQITTSIPKRRTVKPNILETLKSDLGGSVAGTLANEAKRLPADFARQLLGMRQQPRSGEISPGGSIEMNKVLSGQQEAEEKLRQQLAFERRLRQEEQELRTRKEQDLKLQLSAIMQEIQAIAIETPQLAEELKIAAIQAPANPSIYHVFFFEKILEFIKSFRKKVQNANEWLASANSRAAKKGGNVWGKRYKKHGAKYLLSQEHYLTRSAG